MSVENNATILWLSADAWEWIDIVLGIGLVFIGVALEGAAELKRYRRSRIFGFRIARLGLFLVVLGLAVEVICAPFVWYLNHREIAALEASTSEVVESTSVLLEGVAENARHASEALQSASAMADRAAQAELQASEANARAAEAVRRSEEMRQRLAPRGLTGDQLVEIAKKLVGFAGQRYEMTTFWDMKEPLAFTNLIHRGLQVARWENFQSKGFLLGGLEGVEVYVHPKASDAARNAADALVAALEAEGVQGVARKDSGGDPNDDLHINVGTRSLSE